jgi:DNA-directed RNA polymerase subunit RPC12/RpoP
LASQKGPPESFPDRKKVYDACPHCGAVLSPWQKVLLGVDRALMCRQCWYRIILDVFDDTEERSREDKPQSKDEKQ